MLRLRYRLISAYLRISEKGPSVLRNVFKVVAIAEGFSWLALLTAMFFKWVLGHDEAVAIPGMIHGWVFIAYSVLAIAMWRTQGWSMRTVIIALIGGVVPLGTWWVERHLNQLEGESSQPVAAA